MVGSLDVEALREPDRSFSSVTSAGHHGDAVAGFLTRPVRESRTGETTPRIPQHNE